MARIKREDFTEHLSGQLNKELVFKSYSYGMVVTKYPDMSKVKPSELQLREKSRFKEAVAYAKALIQDPFKKAELQATLPKGKSAYHQAIKDYLSKDKEG
jgi:hypothetical protein